MCVVITRDVSRDNRHTTVTVGHSLVPPPSEARETLAPPPSNDLPSTMVELPEYDGDPTITLNTLHRVYGGDYHHLPTMRWNCHHMTLPSVYHAWWNYMDYGGH